MKVIHYIALVINRLLPVRTVDWIENLLCALILELKRRNIERVNRYGQRI